MNGNLPIKEDQHIVPKFYLKFFSKNDFLQVLELKSGKILKARPYASVCYDKFYYAQKTGKIDTLSQAVEDLLSDLENKVSRRYNIILKQILDYKHISNNDRYLLSIFASILWLRGEYMRKQVSRMNEDMMKQMMVFQAERKDFPDFVKTTLKEKNKAISDKEIEEIRTSFINKNYKIGFDNSTHINLMMNFESFANMFYGKNWRVHLALGNKKFITSDNPVIEWFPERTGFYGTSFLERKHYLALSPDILVEMLYPISGKNFKRKVSSDIDIFNFNLLHANFSIKECYANNKEPLTDLINYRNNAVNRDIKLIIKKSQIYSRRQPVGNSTSQGS